MPWDGEDLGPLGYTFFLLRLTLSGCLNSACLLRIASIPPPQPPLVHPANRRLLLPKKAPFGSCGTSSVLATCAVVICVSVCDKPQSRLYVPTRTASHRAGCRERGCVCPRASCPFPDTRVRAVLCTRYSPRGWPCESHHYSHSHRPCRKESEHMPN